MRVATLLCGLCCLLMVGCDSGPKKVPVSGTVTFDGTPVGTADVLAEIIFTAPGQPPDAIRFADGKFTVQVQPGKKRVEIRHSRKVGENEMGAIMEQYIPDRYNDKSELEADITAARSDLEFKLTSK